MYKYEAKVLAVGVHVAHHPTDWDFGYALQYVPAWVGATHAPGDGEQTDVVGSPGPTGHVGSKYKKIKHSLLLFSSA
jgi:hypothetical protein